MCTSDKSKITHDVLAYLAEHQDAQDTLEGIVEWWLIEQKIKRQTVMVRQVLSELVQKNYLLESKGMDARVRYRINHRKKKEIRQFLHATPA
jgi:hypothetical protein